MKSSSSQEENYGTIYAFAHVEQYLEDYAKSAGRSFHELARRVAELLLAQTSGTVRGAFNHLPALPGKTTKAAKGRKPLAVARGPHRKAQVRPRFKSRKQVLERVAAMNKARLAKMAEKRKLKEAA